jgi:hypothetical protein
LLPKGNAWEKCAWKIWNAKNRNKNVRNTLDPSYDYNEDLKKALASAGNPLALLEMAHDAIIVRDVDEVVQFWNRGALHEAACTLSSI